MIVHRISPLDSLVENMAVAGNWAARCLDVYCIGVGDVRPAVSFHAIPSKPDLNK
jgi:hypothetical protein